MSDTPDPVADAIRSVGDRITLLDLNVQRALVELQRSVFAMERQLAVISDALAGWAQDYWQHTDHPPRAS
jgi:hypothetical protein